MEISPDQSFTAKVKRSVINRMTWEILISEAKQEGSLLPSREIVI
ncbi:hypothetical protein BRDCF_p612 [Bacteroidales bacterium CF]|jgi:hypothetical protein|nr:hypothetical protein BRDCF_p612 [Bacteroidales bacterium CF]